MEIQNNENFTASLIDLLKKDDNIDSELFIKIARLNE